MNRPAPEIFADMTWSHERVLADTTARLAALGLSYDILPTWFDLDVVEDFQQLRKLTKSDSRGALSRTLLFLEQSGFWPPSKI
jgi:hypothetical protein